MLDVHANVVHQRAGDHGGGKKRTERVEPGESLPLLGEEPPRPAAVCLQPLCGGRRARALSPAFDPGGRASERERCPIPTCLRRVDPFSFGELRERVPMGPPRHGYGRGSGALIAAIGWCSDWRELLSSLLDGLI